jgi:hypothetical protein
VIRNADEIRGKYDQIIMFLKGVKKTPVFYEVFPFIPELKTSLRAGFQGLKLDEKLRKSILWFGPDRQKKAGIYLLTMHVYFP